MISEQLLLYIDIGASVVMLIAILASYRLLKQDKPTLYEIVEKQARERNEELVEHMKDVYQEAWEGDPIQPDKRINTIRGRR